MNRTRRTAPFSRGFLIAAGLLIVAITFGGGGSPAPGSELVVELAAIVALICWAWFARTDQRPPTASDWPLYIMLALLVLVPLLQIIPLPPSIWQHFPARSAEADALALIGQQSAWRPVSLSPARTIASLLALVVPVAMAFFVSRLSTRDRSNLLLTLGALGVVSALVGAIQLTSGNANWLRFYSVTQYGFATGFQANRNAQADVLLICAIAAGVIGLSRSSRSMILTGAALLLLSASVLLTGSRAGIALIAVLVLTCAIVLLGGRALFTTRRILAVALAGVVLAGVGATIYQNERIVKTIDRFDSENEETRPLVWSDTVFAIEQSWPVGTGVGTFTTVFPSVERLEYVRAGFANRAHNDYLEFVLEAGVVGALLILTAILFVIWRLVTQFRASKSPERRAQLWFVFGTALVIGLHSIVDYPMRSLSLACMVAIAGGLLSRSSSADEVRR